MKALKLSLVAAMLTALFVLASAASPVGTWHGKIMLDATSLPKNLTPQQRQQFNAGMEMIKKMKITIVLKADHTYTATATGNPSMKQQTDTGTWKQAGNQVIISPKRKNSPKSETLTLSADGKTMSMAFPAGAMKGKVLFTR